MKPSTLVLAFALATSGLATGVARADSLSFTINNPSQSTTAGSTVEYDATVATPLSNTGAVYLNGDAFTLVGTGFSLDDSSFFATFPLSLDPGGSYTGELFLLTVPPGTPGGTYNNSFQILGGSTDAADLVLASANFSTTITSSSVTPEPSSFVLLGTGIVGAFAAVRRRLA